MHNRLRSWPGLLAAVLLVIWLSGVATISAAAPSEQALTEAKLKELRAQIAEAAAALKVVEAGRQSELDALKLLDESQALVALAAKARDREAADVATVRTHIVTQQKAMADQVERQRQKLTGLVRQAHAGGRGEGVRALFDREGSDRSLRQLGYLRVLKREREQRIRRLLADARRLAHLNEASHAADKAHAVAARLDALQSAELETRRQAHDVALAALKERLSAQRGVLGELARDERALMELLERLTDVLADVRSDLARQEAPIASRRGQLPWPVRGEVAQKFGVTVAPGRISDGILIAAEPGTPVHAVAHGRIAFAEWLKGYGLLTIIDHGDGVMSLYAQNETLTRELGDWVQAGDAIATVGNSGGNDRVGLYFELRRNSQPQNPLSWLVRE